MSDRVQVQSTGRGDNEPNPETSQRTEMQRYPILPSSCQSRDMPFTMLAWHGNHSDTYLGRLVTSVLGHGDQV